MTTSPLLEILRNADALDMPSAAHYVMIGE